MKTILLRVIAVTMCLMLALALGISDTASAQETKKKDEKAATVDPQEDEGEGDEDAEVAAARLRYGPNKASAKIGEDEIFILAGRPEVEKDTGYAAIDTLKVGELVEPSLSQAIKFSTPFNVKFGDLVVKKENVAPNYPGVYSLWLKKTADGWNIVFNEKPDIWGTMHKATSDVGETPVVYSTLDEPTENMKFTMEAEDGKGELGISWGKHHWSAAFTIEQ